MAETVAERVIRVFAEFKKVPTDEITMDTTFEQLGFDSLDGLNLVFELEEEFDMTIPDDKVADMKGVRQAVEGIEMLLEAKAQGIDINAADAKNFSEAQAAYKAHKEGATTDEAEKTDDAPDKPKQAADAPKKAKSTDKPKPAGKAKKADDAPEKPKRKKTPKPEK
jgi:acyl carrier protein